MASKKAWLTLPRLIGVLSELVSLTIDWVSMRRESAVEATEVKEGFRPGAPFEALGSNEAESCVGVLRALISRDARRLLAGPPSPSLSLVKKPEDAMEPASSTDPLRNGREMLDLDIGFLKDGLDIEKLLGGAAPRIDLRGFAAIPKRETVPSVFVLASTGFEIGGPVCVVLDRSEASESCDSLRRKGSETRLGVDPMC